MFLILIKLPISVFLPFYVFGSDIVKINVFFSLCFPVIFLWWCWYYGNSYCFHLCFCIFDNDAVLKKTIFPLTFTLLYVLRWYWYYSTNVNFFFFFNVMHIIVFIVMSIAVANTNIQCFTDKKIILLLLLLMVFILLYLLLLLLVLLLMLMLLFGVHDDIANFI